MSTHDCWAVTDAVMGVSRRILLHGPPGTGKTYAATRRALTEDQIVYSITMTEETPMAEIRGHFVQKEGSFVWMDGPAVRAWKEGARLVINEIDRAGDDVLSFLYAIMDDPGFASVTLPTGETISPVEGFQLVATMNGGPDDLPDALQDRLPVTIEISDLNPEALQRLPEDLREAARNTSLLDNEARSLSIRAWLEFSTLREQLVDKMGTEGLEVAAIAVFGDRGHEALLALNIADEASPEFVMGMPPKDEEEAAFLMIKEIDMLFKKESLNLPYGGLTGRDEHQVIVSGIMKKYNTLYGYNITLKIDGVRSGREDKPEIAFKWESPNKERTRWLYADGKKL